MFNNIYNGKNIEQIKKLLRSFSDKEFCPCPPPVEPKGYSSLLGLRQTGIFEDTKASESDVEEMEKMIRKRKTVKVKKSRSILTALMKKRKELVV